MSENQKPKRTVEKRSLNAVGKFFARMRIELEMTSTEFAHAAGVSTLSLTNIERGTKPLTLEFVHNVSKIVPDSFEAEFTFLVAANLGVLLIPITATAEQVESAYITLNTTDIGSGE